MKKRMMALFLAAVLTILGGCGAAPAPKETSQPAELVAEYALYEQYGSVLRAEPGQDSVYIVAEGYFGYHMEDSPSMTVGVTITSEGIITKVENVANHAQSEGFAEMVTDDYLAKVYTDVPAKTTLEVDAVSGATVTCKAVMYAVQTAAYYAEKVYDYVADTHAEDREQLSEVYPAAYETLEATYEVDAKKIGTVLYAAEGKADDGTEVVALKVKGANWLNYTKSSNTGWDAAEPSPYTMVIVIDKATDSVIAWKVLADGTKRAEYFAVPDESIDAYKAVPIAKEDTFDAFTGGLVFDLDVELTPDNEGNSLITGTTVIYTGATVDGTFSSQAVRQCFRTAAYFYSNI